MTTGRQTWTRFERGFSVDMNSTVGTTAARFCGFCGTALVAGDAFCSGCGRAVEQPVNVPPQPPLQAPAYPYTPPPQSNAPSFSPLHRAPGQGTVHFARRSTLR